MPAPSVKKRHRVAVLGATGAVGTVMRELLMGSQPLPGRQFFGE